MINWLDFSKPQANLVKRRTGLNTLKNKMKTTSGEQGVTKVTSEGRIEGPQKGLCFLNRGVLPKA